MSNIPGSSARQNSGDNISDDEEQDEPSPNNTSDVENALASFREKWQKELRIGCQDEARFESAKQCKEEDVTEEQQARIAYMQGAELERSGQLYEAIQCYKRAVQLVPDIEFRIDDINIPSIRPNEEVAEDIKFDEIQEIQTDDENDNEVEERQIPDGALINWIQRKVFKSQVLCSPNYEQRSTHICSLPMEILLYILKWVVSADLDMRSLEMVSMVSRGFYLCARDEEIWKLACSRAWGINCGNPMNIYSSWREMYVKRARLHFNGCYISKTTYLRHGENSFQDQFYRPWHLVAYYRYLRFFPDGLVLMLTTPDEPAQCVTHLKTRISKLPTILKGHYRLKDDKVTIVVQHQEVTVQSSFKRGRNRRNDVMFEGGDKTFHLELQIQSYNTKKHIQLIWTHYAIITKNRNGTESKSSFELVNNRFPPLWFSRVKSYTQESYSPLQ
ncbi:PREDICTED: F-box only protein 9 isoform X2 [Nicrophorus vespilloides]|uniref:F-box only protein 9 isoform X2 n=1 Tax=Nicrophorus vespilloides TaxID=110193 RepID=A0ABM1MRV6_NICVS|nr:PREDICTED: F-box only protein 9 isoform X2 [Nicrophorus vespilloides]